MVIMKNIIRNKDGLNLTLLSVHGLIRSAANGVAH